MSTPLADEALRSRSRLRQRLDALPPTLEVEIESPRGSVIKRRPSGAVDFVSPLPVPYNYGFVPGRMGGDGDPLDAIILGRRLPRSSRVCHPVLALVGFIDEGATDDKVVVGPAPLPLRWELSLHAFFRAYAQFKRGLARVRGRDPHIAFIGIAVRR